ncbi:MAG: FAD-dependent oxidoreductase [Dehalococcoidia bacterium]
MNDGQRAIECDVAVMGSGAAGLSAALTAAALGRRTVVVEKAAVLGGTTAISSGTAWVPASLHAAKRGLDDTADEAKAYLREISRGEMGEEYIEAFVTGSTEAIAFFEAHSPLRWLSIGYPDYHPEAPGGRTDGRTLLPRFFDADSLGEAKALIRTSPYAPPAFRGVDLAADGLKNGRWANGYALVGALVKGCLDAGVEFHRGTAARRLIVEDGAVRGLEAESADGPLTFRTSRGVVLASGGFEWNTDLTKAFLRGPLEGGPGPRANTGDGLVMAMEVGAALGNMSEAWWMPTVQIPGERDQDGEVYRMTWHERALPGSIIVNRRGQRFVNEAHNYSDIGRAFHHFDANTYEWPNVPAWMVFDHEYLERFGIPSTMPGDPQPGWLKSYATLAALADDLGIDPGRLETTVERFNGFARMGKDPDFGRGESAFDQFHGDETRQGPLKALRPLEPAPFHALRMYIGALATSGGPKTDASGAVLNVRGEVIPGLYAAGNAMASATGRVYPGAGGTIGLALTFGHLAGRALATG